MHKDSDNAENAQISECGSGIADNTWKNGTVGKSAPTLDVNTAHDSREDAHPNVSRETLSHVKKESATDADEKQLRHLKHKQQKQAYKDLELRRIKHKCGIEQLQETQFQSELPSFSSLYARFRRNKLSVIESAYNAAYLYCNNRYYTSNTPIKEKYKNIYAHPEAWFRNHVGMWKHNRWSAAVRLLEIIPDIKRYNNKLLHQVTRVESKLKSLLRHFEYSRVAMRSLGRFFARFFPPLVLVVFVIVCGVRVASALTLVPSLELYIDGSYIGCVPSVSSVEQAMSTYEESLSLNLGRAYRLNVDATYKPTTIRHGEELSQNKLIAAFDEASAHDMQQGYGLYVDGRLIGAAPYNSWFDTAIEDSLENVRKSVSSDGKNADVEAVDYYNNMSISAGSFPIETFMSRSEIRKLFSLGPVTNADMEFFREKMRESFHGMMSFDGDASDGKGSDTTMTLPVLSGQTVNNVAPGVVTDVASGETNSAAMSDKITLDVVVQKVVTENEEIPFETVYTYDDTMLIGKSVIETEGVNGSKTVTYNLSLVGDKIVDKKAVDEIINYQPVTQIVVAGTRQMTEEEKRTMSKGTYIWPFKGKVSSEYSWRVNGSKNEFHKGIDICGKQGEDIVASDGGMVTFSGWDNTGYGECIIIQHDDGTKTRYAHCSELYVTVGQKVGQGEVIAALGQTGNASGVHVHFEIIKDGKTVNPRDCLQD